MSSAEYADLHARGYRRFGSQVFRPTCRICQKCQSLRVLVQQFTANAGERRILRKNRNIRAELNPLFATTDHVELYDLYHRFMNEHRGWPLQQTTLESYRLEFLSWLYFEEDKLVGVSLMDEVPGADLIGLSLLPPWLASKPARNLLILNQILYAKASNLQYAYLGYWIESCHSMSYKGRFRPRQIVINYPGDDEPPAWE